MNPTTSQKIRLIEDDRTLVEILAYNPHQAGYAPNDGMDGLSQARLMTPDVVIPDIMLPSGTAWRSAGRCAAILPPGASRADGGVVTARRGMD